VIGRTGAISDSPMSKEGLRQPLKRRHIVLISLGGAIGAGLFVGSSVSIAGAGPAIVLSYLVAGCLLALIMRMLAELTLAHPGTRVLSELLRAELGPGVAFVIGWSYWYLWTMTVAIESVAGGVLLHAWVPLPSWVLGLGVMLLMLLVNLSSTRTFGEFEFWFASLKVAAIVVFMSVALAYVAGLGSAAPSVDHLVREGGFFARGGWAVVAGVTTVFFSLSGAEITTVAAAESSESSRSVAWITTTLALRLIAFYAGSVLLIVCVVPWSQVRPGESPFSLALDRIGLHWAATGMTVVVLTAILSCLNSAFYVSSRVLFWLASRGDAPKAFLSLNGRRVPSRAVLLAGATASGGIGCAMTSPGGVFAFLINTCGALILAVYLSICIAYIAMRSRHARQGLRTEGWRLAPYPAISYLTVVCIMGVLIVMGNSKELASQLYAGCLPIVLMAAAYLMIRRRRQALVAGST